MKLSKKIICTTLLLAIVLPTSMQPVSANNLEADSKISTYAWPGRPGGNGDGSEEYLDGNYGEMNGLIKK